ncbi:MAG: thiaminase II, partial [Ilumatobacter fluminis]
IWNALLANRFVAAMADGTLPPDAFRYYIEQNLYYLPEYARAMGLGLARATSDAVMARFARSLAQIVDVELGNNQALRDAVVDLGAGDHGGALEMAPATQAYTNFLLATASTGDEVDVLAAILPCAWSYREIAIQYRDPVQHPVYSDWLRFFSSDEYSNYLERLLDELDDLVGPVAPERLSRLGHLFRTGARYELAFWEQGFTLSTWPDRSPNRSAR